MPHVIAESVFPQMRIQAFGAQVMNLDQAHSGLISEMPY